MQAVLHSPAAVPEATALGGVIAAPVRSVEWVIFTFLVYASVISAALPISPVLRSRIILLNAAIIIGYGLLIRADAVRPRLVISVVRDWLPLALILLAYREAGWFAVPHPRHDLEMRWVAWDRAFLHGGFKTIIESLGPVLPSLLEIAYGLVYTLAPFCVAILYVSGNRQNVGRFLLVFATGVLICYAQLPFWPSDPPRSLFPGEDVPSYLTVFRRFNLWMLSGAGIHTGVFPSAHVAGAFSAAFGLRRATAVRHWVHHVLLAMAILIAVATVYGRYHYLADAAAGLLMAAFALGFSHVLNPARTRRAASSKEALVAARQAAAADSTPAAYSGALRRDCPASRASTVD